MPSDDDAVLAEAAAMAAAIKGAPNADLYGSSSFWDGLGERHLGHLHRHGFSSFKRTVNFEYNQWGVSTLTNPQFWSVLLRLLEAGALPTIAMSAKARTAPGSAIAWPVPSSHALWVYKAFVGALWHLASLKDQLGVLASCQEPLVGGPLEITYGDRLISQDLAQSSLEVNRIASHVDMTRVSRIAEIGAGYGRLAYVIATIYPTPEYCIFDIPPALAVAQQYLACTLGRHRIDPFDERGAADRRGNGTASVRVFLPHQLATFPDDYFDLVINVSSFDEMRREQIEGYLRLIDRKCRGWLYLKGYRSRDGSDPQRPFGVDQFPYPPTWTIEFHGRDLVQPKFVESIYRVP